MIRLHALLWQHYYDALMTVEKPWTHSWGWPSYIDLLDRLGK